MELGGQSIERAVVLGCGYSGQAIARTLVRLGLQVGATDSRATDDPTVQAGLRVMTELGVEAHAGGHDSPLLANADLIVLSPGVGPKELALRGPARRGVPIWGEIELASHLTQARLVGITGTKGKSTTAALTALMLDAPLTNSEAYTARGIPLVELVIDNPQADPIVVEVTSYQLETIVDFRPWVSALLNIAEDHVERHPTRAEYAAAKARIFENQQPGDRAVVNLDDPLVAALPTQPGVTRLAYSLVSTPEYGVWATADGVQARLPAELGGFDGLVARWSAVHANLRAQKPAVLAATAIALAAEAPLAQVRDTLATFAGLRHRMEFVRELDDVTYVNDSKATNPLATANAIAQSGGPVVLIAGGQSKGIDLSPLVEPFRDLRALVLIGESAPLLTVIGAQAGLDAIYRADSLAAAVEQARALAQPGDWVIMSPAGASFDLFENFVARGDSFCQLVQNLDSA